jgi:hypothetical protein
VLLTARAGKVSFSGSILLLGFTIALLTAALVDLAHGPVHADAITAGLVLVDAYYQTGAFRRVVYWLVGGVLIYIAGACVYAWVTGLRV